MPAAVPHSRVQRGVPQGGQFAATPKADASLSLTEAEPAVAQAEKPDRRLPAEVVAAIPSGDRISEFSDAAYEQYRSANAALTSVNELRLARAGVDLYTEHGITSIHVRGAEDTDGSFVIVESVDLDTGETLDEGDAYDAAEEAVVAIGLDADTLDDVTGETMDLIDLIERAPELERVAQAAVRKPVTAADVLVTAEILTAAQQESRVRWSDNQGETVRSGIMRTGTWNAEGQPQRFDDIRDAHLRITTDTGAEIFRSMTDLVRLRGNAELHLDQR